MNQLPEPPFWNPLATQNEKDPTVNPGKFSWMGSDGRVYFDLHEGQEKALESEARFIAIIAGTQSGKTESGPPWLYNEIAKRGPGDYIVASPTYPLLQKKALPAFIELFDTKLKLGRYFPGSKQFKFSKEGSRRIFGRYVDERTIVFFGNAQDPESLESATAKAAWLDEAGQRKFKLASWEALQRRLAMHIGRAFITTTPYDLGWLKKQIYDRWKAGDKDYEVINFRSTMNPAFSLREYNRAMKTLPRWKFDLFYNGIFTRQPVRSMIALKRDSTPAHDSPSLTNGSDCSELISVASILLACSLLKSRRRGGCSVIESTTKTISTASCMRDCLTLAARCHARSTLRTCSLAK